MPTQRARRPRARTHSEPQSRRPSAKAIVQGVGAIIGVTATLVALIFAVWPSLKPAGPPQEKGASLEHLVVNEVITRRQYFQRAQLPPTGFTANQLSRRGLYVTFDISIKGYSYQDLPLRWELVNTATGSQMAQSESTIFKPLAQSDSASWQEWIPLPPGRRTYVVFVRLYDPAGRVPLATERADTGSV